MVFTQMPEKFLSRLLAVLTVRRQVHSLPESARPKSSSSLVVPYNVKRLISTCFLNSGVYW